jgi:hypothetical protein
MSKSIVEFTFSIGDQVYIDRDPTLVANVTGLQVNPDSMFQLAWMFNGDPKSAWFEEWRLTEVPPEEKPEEYEKLKPAYFHTGK